MDEDGELVTSATRGPAAKYAASVSKTANRRTRRSRNRRRPAIKRWEAALLVVAVAFATVLCVWALRPVEPPPSASATAGAAAANPAPTPAKPSALWIGDSYTFGTGADNTAKGEACLASDAMGWICNVDGQGGTGYVRDGKTNAPTNTPVIERLEQNKDQYLADVVVLDVGRNDYRTPADELRPRVDKVLRTISAQWPKAKIVMVAPYAMTVERDPIVADVLKAAAEDADAYYVDPVAEGWMDLVRGKSMATEDGHPNAAGHEYIASHLATAFKAIGLDKVEVTDLPRDGV